MTMPVAPSGYSCPTPSSSFHSLTSSHTSFPPTFPEGSTQKRQVQRVRLVIRETPPTPALPLECCTLVESSAPSPSSTLYAPSGSVGFANSQSQLSSIQELVTPATSAVQHRQNTRSHAGDLPARVKRPANAFLVFRSFLIRSGLLGKEVEINNRKISKIAGQVWNQLSDDDKRPFRQQASKIAADHQEKYPNYRYNPIGPGPIQKRKYTKPAYTSHEQDLMLAMASVITEALASSAA